MVCDSVVFCSLTGRTIPSHEMMWLDYVCERNEAQMAEQIKSPSPSCQDEIAYVNSLLSSYQPPSVLFVDCTALCVFYPPFLFSNHSSTTLPVQVWYVLAKDGGSPLSPLISASYTFTSYVNPSLPPSPYSAPSVSLFSLLQNLDKIVSSPTLVLFCDIMELIASITVHDAVQEVTFSSSHRFHSSSRDGWRGSPVPPVPRARASPLDLHLLSLPLSLLQRERALPLRSQVLVLGPRHP